MVLTVVHGGALGLTPSLLIPKIRTGPQLWSESQPFASKI